MDQPDWYGCSFGYPLADSSGDATHHGGSLWTGEPERHNLMEMATPVMGKRAAEFIRRHIVADPRKPGVANARVAESGSPVWALVPYLKLYERDYARVAEEFGISKDAAEAADAYYRQNEDALEAKIAANFGE